MPAAGPAADPSLLDALERYYADAGLPPDGGDSQAWVRLRIGPLHLPFPNPPVRKRAVLYHDAHHVLTGYDTVFGRGEMIIAGWEVGAGCAGVWLAWLINLWMFALGLLWTPRRMFAAFVRGRACDSLYRRREPRAVLLERTVGELRRSLGLAAPPPAPGAADRLLFLCWGAAAWATLLLSAAVALLPLLALAAAVAAVA